VPENVRAVTHSLMRVHAHALALMRVCHHYQ
jgi:hypothetical protein